MILINPTDPEPGHCGVPERVLGSRDVPPGDAQLHVRQVLDGELRQAEPHGRQEQLRYVREPLLQVFIFETGSWEAWFKIIHNI